jgi:hypothetical protein
LSLATRKNTKYIDDSFRIWRGKRFIIFEGLIRRASLICVEERMHVCAHACTHVRTHASWPRTGGRRVSLISTGRQRYIDDSFQRGTEQKDVDGKRFIKFEGQLW